MHRLKHTWSKFGSQAVFGAGVAVSRAGQAAGEDPVRTWVTVLVLAAIGLPIVMGIIGAVTMRFLGWFTRDPEAAQDEVVMPAPRLPHGVHLPEPTIWPAVLAFGLMGLMFAIVLRSWLALGAGVLLGGLGLAGWVVLEVKEFRVRRP